MEANNNNELKQQWWYKSTIISLHNSISDIVVNIISLHDIKQNDIPTPIIDLFYSLLVLKVVDKESLNEILDNVNKKILNSEQLTDYIRQEMNI